MHGKVTQHSVITEHQGRLVLVQVEGQPKMVLTIVHAVTENGEMGRQHEMRLVNKDKSRTPDWRVTQEMWEAMTPIKQCKYSCAYGLTMTPEMLKGMEAVCK